MNDIKVVVSSNGESTPFWVGLLPLINIALAIYAIFNLRKKGMKPIELLLWVLFILFVPLIGPLISIVIVRKKGKTV
jgi:hypothetical protein